LCYLNARISDLNRAMTSTLEVSAVMQNGEESIEIGGEILSISRIYMWQNNMPHISISGSAARRGQNITVHIKRSPSEPTDTDTGLASAAPSVLKLHVAQVGAVEELVSITEPNESKYYTWEAPQLKGEAIAALADNEAEAIKEQFVLTRPLGWRGVADEIELQAWNGPTWASGMDFIALVEFEGGKVLRSGVQTADVVC